MILLLLCTTAHHFLFVDITKTSGGRIETQILAPLVNRGHLALESGIRNIIWPVGAVFMRPNYGKTRAAADGAVMTYGMAFGVQFHYESSG